MRKTLYLLCTLFTLSAYAGDKDSTKAKTETIEEADATVAAVFAKLDSVEKAINYQSGKITLLSNVATLNIPKGFKFINAEQSQFILEDLWENVADASVLGMIVSDSFHVNSLKSDCVFVVTYDAMGYVKDDDADKINYDDLLKELKEGQDEANKERKKLGYDIMTLKGWASPPYYDKQNKVLHWAKEISIEGSEVNTLNYDIRVLGRKGVLSINAVGHMDQLSEVKQQIPTLLKIASFDEGQRYEDFDSNVDEVAAWTIGGLVAGKVLAKVGFFAILLKFWKLIALGIGGAFVAVRKFFFKKKEDEYQPVPAEETNNDSTPTT